MEIEPRGAYEYEKWVKRIHLLLHYVLFIVVVFPTPGFFVYQWWLAYSHELYFMEDVRTFFDHHTPFIWYNIVVRFVTGFQMNGVKYGNASLFALLHCQDLNFPRGIQVPGWRYLLWHLCIVIMTHNLQCFFCFSLQIGVLDQPPP